MNSEETLQFSSLRSVVSRIRWLPKSWPGVVWSRYLAISCCESVKKFLFVLFTLRGLLYSTCLFICVFYERVQSVIPKLLKLKSQFYSSGKMEGKRSVSKHVLQPKHQRCQQRFSRQKSYCHNRQFFSLLYLYPRSDLDLQYMCEKFNVTI